MLLGVFAEAADEEPRLHTHAVVPYNALALRSYIMLLGLHNAVVLHHAAVLHSAVVHTEGKIPRAILWGVPSFFPRARIAVGAGVGRLVLGWVELGLVNLESA